jgi:hypothetical protein
MLSRKVQDVPDARAAKRVDALRIVADDREIPMRRAHAAKDSRLQDVRVLVLIDEEVIVEAGDAGADLRRILEKQRPEEQQVVVVDEVPLRLACRVVGEHPDDRVEILHELWHLAANDVHDIALGVDVPGVDVVQRLLLRKPLLLAHGAELRPRQLHQVGGVALIHDDEVTGQSRRRAEPAKQPVRRRVKRPAVDPRAGRADELRRP